MKRILFVCTGNTCRSPMAEAILKSKKIDGLEVKSAGIYAATGSEASAHAKKVLEDHHIEHNHSSNMLTLASVHWADLILTMTGSHKNVILQQYPETAGKVFTLKEFSGVAYDVDVVDPFGGSVEIYQETYQELDRLITKAIEKM
ncbi:low molecular weight protein arginine phosphatase [Neobacillus sp. 179-C4.2 HS]|uniref:Low molecular weight protein arginine phosphatase n=1 Tax=Neobacillus driksii TaxID=3035913 RepID=A0ABV4Z1F4_9BACI|nr:low molecular weight protein arginine phosphatase [Neobacillus sp. 179.-C4.2 HS]MDP5194485.1 low molecular weight protein arginine phosphatase [Neobacillus sp. 179.-C4.2 HS]